MVVEHGSLTLDLPVKYSASVIIFLRHKIPVVLYGCETWVSYFTLPTIASFCSLL